MTGAQELGLVLERLAPPGVAWPRGSGTTARAVLEGLAGRPAELERRAAQLLRELDPRTTSELAVDFERLLELPDPLVGGERQTLVERRVWIVQRLTALSGATPAELVRLAALLGTAIEVEEFHAFRAGRSYAGDLLSNGDWLHAVRVHAPVATGALFHVGQSGAGDALFALQSSPLEHLVESALPAHVVGVFAYDLGADTSWQPWNPATVRPSTFGAAPSVVPYPTLAEA